MTAGPAIKPRILDLPQFPPTSATPGSQGAVPPAKMPSEPTRPLQLPLAQSSRALTTGETDKADKTEPRQKRSRLPRSASLNHHRNAANATTAVEILSQVSEAIAAWHGELRQVIEQMQQVYRGGPVVDGWLESTSSWQSEAPMAQEQRAFWRHSDPAQLSQYLESCWGQSASLVSPPAPASPATTTGPHPSTYRLCYLDGEGQIQCQVCPPEQLGAISQGIARYQQLRQLDQRKQWLEEKLRQAAIALGHTRDRLGLTP